MIDIFECAINRFNTIQKDTCTIEKKFHMANQDPLCNSREEFMDHLVLLETGSIYITTF